MNRTHSTEIRFDVLIRTTLKGRQRDWHQYQDQEYMCCLVKYFFCFLNLSGRLDGLLSIKSINVHVYYIFIGARELEA